MTHLSDKATHKGRDLSRFTKKELIDIVVELNNNRSPDLPRLLNRANPLSCSHRWVTFQPSPYSVAYKCEYCGASA